jgi:hypothetical protein
MDNNERLQAAKVAFTLFQEKLAADYGVVIFANQKCETYNSASSMQSQITSEIALTLINGWSLPSTVNNEGGKDDK